MIELSVNDKLVESIGFKVEPKILIKPEFSTMNVLEVCDKFIKDDFKFFTVIFIQDALKEELVENQKYMKSEDIILCSIVEEEARKRMLGKYYTHNEINQIFDFSNSDEKFINKITDLIHESQHFELYPEIIEEFKLSCYFEKNFFGDQEKSEKKWMKLKKTILMPRIFKKLKRVIDLPFPFNLLGDDLWKQWFFIYNESKCNWVHGSGLSKELRKNYDEYSKIFGYLSGKYSQNIPTFVFKYNSENKIELLKYFDDLKIMISRVNKENYNLFKDKLIKLDYNFDCLGIECFN